MREWLKFEAAVLTLAADRSAKAASSSVNSILGAALTTAIATAVITGGVVTNNWWPALGAVGLIVLTFLWHQSVAPYRLWTVANARISELEGRVARGTKYLDLARWLEAHFESGERLLATRLNSQSTTDQLEDWRGTYDSWCEAVSFKLATLHEKDRFMFDSIGFEARATGYRTINPYDQHKARIEDLRDRLVKLRLITNRVYGLADPP